MSSLRAATSFLGVAIGCSHGFLLCSCLEAEYGLYAVGTFADLVLGRGPTLESAGGALFVEAGRQDLVRLRSDRRPPTNHARIAQPVGALLLILARRLVEPLTNFDPQVRFGDIRDKRVEGLVGVMSIEGFQVWFWSHAAAPSPQLSSTDFFSLTPRLGPDHANGQHRQFTSGCNANMSVPAGPCVLHFHLSHSQLLLITASGPASGEPLPQRLALGAAEADRLRPRRGARPQRGSSPVSTTCLPTLLDWGPTTSVPFPRPPSLPTSSPAPPTSASSAPASSRLSRRPAPSTSPHSGARTPRQGDATRRRTAAVGISCVPTGRSRPPRAARAPRRAHASPREAPRAAARAGAGVTPLSEAAATPLRWGPSIVLRGGSYCLPRGCAAPRSPACLPPPTLQVPGGQDGYHWVFLPSEHRRLPSRLGRLRAAARQRRRSQSRHTGEEITGPSLC